MPELPEVETVRRTLAPLIERARVRSAWSSGLGLHQGREVPLRRLRSLLRERKIATVGRRGKYLLIQPAGQRATVLVHLGMTGRFVMRTAGSRREPHTHLELGFLDGRRLGFVDPRRFGQVRVIEGGADDTSADNPLAALGPEPLGRRFNRRFLGRALAKRRAPIKSVLLDQRVACGMGNIYASECLFAARIHPATLAQDLHEEAVARLVTTIKATLRRAIARSGTTLRDYRDARGEEGSYQSELAVFGREGELCRCGSAHVERLVQSGRSTFLCSVCQPLT